MCSVGVRRVACATLVLALLAAGCGDDDDDKGSGGRAGTTPIGGQGGSSGTGIGGSSGSVSTSGTGGNSGSGGSSGTGGSAGSRAGSGGSGMTVMLDDGGVCTTMEPNEALTMGAKKCPMEICQAQDSVCIGTGAIQATSGDAVAAALANCDADNKCVPIKLVQTHGKVIPKTCR